MNKVKLKKDYENACNAYLKAFCEKHEFYGLDNPETFWIGDQVGGIANCGDFTFDMATIVTDIDKDAPEEELLKWYDYTIEASEFNLPVPNLDHWLMGCPITPSKWFENMRAKRKEFEDLLKQENERLKNEKSNLYNHLQRLFDEGLCMKTTELEFGTLEVTVENRSQAKQITFFAKGMEDAKQKAMEWQVGQMLLNCDDFEEIVMFLAQRKKLKKEMSNG